MRRLKLKACKRCHTIVPKDVQRCPRCGSDSFGESFEGMIVVFDPERSELAKILNIKDKGVYAVKVYD